MMSMITLWISEGFGQVQMATTVDNQLFSSNIPCTGSGCWPAAQLPYAQMGVSVNYDLPYTNSGAFKLEMGGNQLLTWVTDFERNDFYDLKASISHWDLASSTASAPPTELEGTGTTSDPETVFDPDVVQMGDELFVVYYSIAYIGGGINFPGNGTILSNEFRVIFEKFSATDPPVQLSISTIQNTPTPQNVLYAKNPNIDVSVNDQIAMTWEEQNTTETSNHVYARTFDNSTGLSATAFDLDPLDFDYKTFYNPDIACAFSEESSLSNDDQPVYITFVGENEDGGLDLLVYHATYGDIRTAATASPSNLYVVDNLNLDVTVAIGNNLRDYLSRPRIASRPLIGFNGLDFEHQYNIVVPELSFDYQYGTNINGYVADIPSGAFFTQTIYTQTSASSANIDCHVNYEPCTDVNQEGYEIVWNADEHALWAGMSPNAPSTVNPACFPFGSSYYEQTILRKSADVSGNAVYNDYSVVPDVYSCCWTYTPSVAYDRFQITGASSGSTADHTFFGFHHDIYDQKTLYKLSQYTNQSLKRGQNREWVDDKLEVVEPNAIVKTDRNRFRITTNDRPDKISLFDMHGRNLDGYRFTLSDQVIEVDLNNLAPGIYLLSYFDGMQFHSHKLQSVR